MITQFQADPAEAGTRLDVFLAGAMAEMTRSHVQKLIEEGRVTVNGAAAKGNRKLKAGDSIVCDVPDPKPAEITAEEIPLDILYEDDDVILVNKPKGMVVHPAAGHESGTLVNALMFHCGDRLSGINGILRPGIVHRIDRDTTGVLVICKNDAAHLSLAEQLKEHSITRKYRAIVSGVLKEDEGTVDSPIARDPKDRKKMKCGMPDGRRAVTHSGDRQDTPDPRPHGFHRAPGAGRPGLRSCEESVPPGRSDASRHGAGIPSSPDGRIHGIHRSPSRIFFETPGDIYKAGMNH